MLPLRKSAAVAAIWLFAAAAAAAQETPRPRFCIVPVQDAAPGEKEQASRMLSRVVMLPGLPRPVIYTNNRPGAWTIDEQRAFVPFGGVFPVHAQLDRFVADAETGRIVGSNELIGIFTLDPGETEFKLRHAAVGKPLKRPYATTFIPRLKGFVVSDASGLYLLNRAGELSPLSAVGPALRAPLRTIDLPAFGAVLVSTEGPHAVVRFDDGELVRVASLERDDAITSVEVAADGTLSIQGNHRTYTARLEPPPPPPLVQGRSFEIANVQRSPEFRIRVDAPSIGKRLHINRRTGISEETGKDRRPLKLPFNPGKEPIEDVAELPQSKAVLIFTEQSVYALDADGSVTEVPGGRTVGSVRLEHFKGIIPTRNEMIVLGARALHLVLDSAVAGPAACRPAG